MTTIPNAPRMGDQITAWIRTKMAEGYKFPEDECLKQMHLAAGLVGGVDFTPGNGHDPWAIEAFDHSTTAVHETNPAKVPGDVYVYLRSKKAGRPGHICWAPVPSGHVLTTDDPKSGRFGDSTIQALCAKWGMTLVGYDRCLNGYRMSQEPAVRPVPPKPTKPVSRGVNIDTAIKRLVAAEKANAHTNKLPHIKAALVALRAITPR